MVALEETSRKINDPVAKLRYLRGSIAEYQDNLTRKDPKPQRSTPLVASLAATAVLAFGAAAWYFSRPTAAAPETPATLPAVAEALPALPAGTQPASIWLVEKNDASEQYSNGLRIDTTWEVQGDPRRFRAFEAGRGMREEVQDKPIGILFHTSESDIWPLDESFNENLRTSSQNLLRYLQKNHVYNYLIDRFGRVFRVVTDETKANHAGHSVWTKDDAVYLGLNPSFLGVSFETRWEGGRALPITAAQLAAGRNLTDWLRQRFEIPADMCTGHGLVSVNAKKHLIGHHVDWARGFPFEAFGLPDQYTRQAPHVALFGLGYDTDFLKVMGEPWPGVREAE
ncbi:MAG TPA: peptidoglycan recognition family protein, partial [Vicinamibacteria bacterium]